jgi:hypothetical protein
MLVLNYQKKNNNEGSQMGHNETFFKSNQGLPLSTFNPSFVIYYIAID